MSATVNEIKSKIIGSSIQEYQERVSAQWINTFKYNDLMDPGTCIAKILLACVAQGEFKVASQLMGDTSLQNPLEYLTAVDYISHASRIIIDYKELKSSSH